MITGKITGLDKLQRKLNDLERRFRDLDDKRDMPVSELLTDAFVSRYTQFTSFDNMFKASGFKIETQADFAAIPDAEWNEFIRSVSSFESWKAMLSAATKEWAVKRLGLA